MRYFRPIRKVGFYIWNANHMFIHILLGLLYAWFLRELWSQFNIRYIYLSVLGSILIDGDHFLFYFTYGRHEWYAKEVRKLLKQGQIRNLWLFIKYNHKNNTGLATHNIYFISFFFMLSLVSFLFNLKVGVILCGAIVLHLVYDAFDDLVILGYLNENWKHLRRRKGGGNTIAYMPESSQT